MKVKNVSVKIEAAPSSDPIVVAARSLSFTAKEGSRKILLKYNGSGKGYTVPAFFELMNHVLRKTRKPGDKVFVRPQFNGSTIMSEAFVSGTRYIAEIYLGGIEITKMPDKTK